MRSEPNPTSSNAASRTLRVDMVYRWIQGFFTPGARSEG
jgi:hypothetical protein